jgi:hypothetical protein
LEPFCRRVIIAILCFMAYFHDWMKIFIFPVFDDVILASTFMPYFQFFPIFENFLFSMVFCHYPWEVSFCWTLEVLILVFRETLGYNLQLLS